MHVYLETDRLLLRRLTPDDVAAVVELDSDPAVMRYLTGGRATPLEEVRDEVLPFWLAYYERGEQLYRLRREAWGTRPREASP